MKDDKSKSTILVITMGFLILYTVFSWKWAFVTSLVIGIGAILSGAFSRFVEKIWMKLSKLLSHIIPTLLLGIVFYLFLFPLSLLYKLFNKDPLMLSNNYESYFITVNKQMSKKDMEKIW